MDRSLSPTIKGIFIKSHVRAVFRAKGRAGVEKLQTCFGRPLQFANSENVFIRDEVTLIECAVRIIFDDSVPEEKIEYEAGKLHFRNFSGTPLGRIVLPFFKKSYKTVLLRSRHIAEHVFRGVIFSSEDLGPRSICITMANADYPIDHFAGFFQAWTEYSNLKGSVKTKKIRAGIYAYTISWE